MPLPSRFPLLCLCAVGALLLAVAAQSAPFTNGSFEAGPPVPAPWITLFGGDTSITGWTVRADSIDYIGSHWTAQDGSRSLDLDGNTQGGIQQTFDTVSEHAYLVTFYLAGNPGGEPTVKLLDVWATGNPTVRYAFDITGHSQSAMGWQQQSYSFTATGASTTLVFQSADGSASGPALDNVSVTDVSPVPALSRTGVAAVIFLLAALGCWTLVRRAAL